MWCWVCTLLGSEISGCSLHAVFGVWSVVVGFVVVLVLLGVRVVRVFGLVGVVV